MRGKKTGNRTVTGVVLRLHLRSRAVRALIRALCTARTAIRHALWPCAHSPTSPSCPVGP